MAVLSEFGRSRSVRTEEEEIRILDQELDNLEPEEVETLVQLLEEIQSPKPRVVRPVVLPDGTQVEDRGKPLFDLLQEVEFERPVVSVEEWLSDSYFMGNAEFRWPRWREDLIELFSKGYHECILTGAIGIGKSTFVEMALTRMIYEFSCLRAPHQTYDLMAGSQIYIGCMNINQDLAKRVVYDKVAERIDSCPYFEKEFPCEYTQKEMRFPKGLHVVPRSSDDRSMLGLNVIGCVMSETNFMEAQQSVTNKKQARARLASWAKHGLTSNVGEVYNELLTRIKSRFGRVGKLPGLFLLDSSKRDQSDWMEEHLIDVKDDPFVFVRDYAIWDVQPAGRFSKKKFRVFVGDERVSSRILGDDEVVVPEPGTKQQIIEVPDNWRTQFDRDIDSAIRNVAGIATINIERFFGSGTMITKAQDLSVAWGNPFDADVILATDKMTVHWDRIAEIVDGAWRLRRDPKVDHAVHLDMSLSRDRFGVGMGYVGGEKLVQRVFKTEDGAENVTEKMPVIVVRWAVAFQAQRDREIQLPIGRALVWSAMQHGHRVRWGSADSYQSVETLQKMEAKGIETETLSVEGEEAYLCLRDAIQEERLILPKNDLLYTELIRLVHDKINGVVDHPPGWSKDIADAICGVVFRLTVLYLQAQAKPPAPSPAIGVSEFMQDEEVEEQFWVLGPNTARPVVKEDIATSVLKGGSGVTDQKGKGKPFIVR